MANLRVDKITSTETFETTGSVQFDGSSDYLSLAVSSDFQFGSGDFTIECWALAFDEGTDDILGIYNTGSDRRTFALRKDQTESMQFLFSSDGSSGTSVDSADGIISLNTWHHYAVVRKDLEYTIYLDGKNVGSKVSSDAIYTNSDDGLRIGSSYNTDFDGHISNVRIIKGKALYTANFKPPMRELEVTPETVLLACQSKTDATLEKTGKTLTANGTAVASELTPGLLTPVPKDGGGSAITGSVEFNGGGAGQNISYLQFPSDDDLILSGDFTIELWIRPGSIASSGSFHIFANEAQDTTFQYSNSDTNVIVYDGSNRTLGSLDKGEWAHVAIVRSGSTLQAYKNGNKFGASWTNSSTTRFTFSSTLLGSRWQTGNNFDGFISNFRVVKGTALYTDNFIPPTRELKKVPGTVLLCCQDPDNPLTEATGKTITGYGDLYELDENVDLSTTASWVDGSTGAGSASESNGELTMQGNDASNRGIISKTVTQGIKPGVTYQMSFEVFDAATNGKTGLDSNDGTSDVLDDPTATLDMVHFSGSDLDGNTGIFTVEGVATTHQVVMYFQEFGAAGTTEFKVRNITLRAVNADSTNINKASNFTPQVGDDRKVTFEGVTKINSDAYFYLPTGDTVTRDSRYGRGIFMGGYKTSPSTAVGDIHYINIPSMGNSFEFGDLVNAARWAGGSCGSSTRGLYGGGATPTSTDHIDFVTIATTSDALDFGNLATAQGYLKACSNQTRGIWGGGRSSNSPVTSSDVIQYITIASTGNAIDFGNLTSARTATGNTASPVRALFGGGYTSPSSADTNIIDFVAIQSTGNAVDFGDLIEGVNYTDVASSGIRGVWGGGNPSPAGDTDRIQYVNIASTGNAQDFGDLSQSAEHISCTDNSIRGVWGGGVTPTYLNVLQYVTIATLGNAKDFGDLSRPNLGYAGGTSDSHGGLG